VLKLATKFVPERTAFQRAGEAGYRFAEFWLDDRLLANWPAITNLASEFPLAYALHFPNRGDLEEAALRNAVELYRALGCSAMVIHSPMLRRYQEQLLSHNAAVRLAVENHRLDANEFQQWAEENQWLTLDVEHFWKFTLENAPLQEMLTRLGEFLHRFGYKLIHVHLPGYLPGYAEHRPMYCARDMVLPVLSLLAEHAFGGFIVSEVELEFQNPYDLRMDVLLFERWQELCSEMRALAH